MLSGSVVALITPMDGRGEVDHSALKALVNYHIEAGTSAIVSMGTTGESATLPIDEHIDVVLRTLEYADGRIPIIAGTGSNCTRSAIASNLRLADSGIVAGLSVTPYYNKPTQEGLYQHYLAITQACELPQILYNVPARTGCDMLPETVARLAKLESVIGLKEASGCLQRLAQLRQSVTDDFLLFSGDDSTGCDFMLQGGDGVISVTSNIAPSQMRAMCQAALRGDQTQAYALDHPLRGLHQQLFIESNPIPVKWACHKLGLIPENGIRLPLTTLSQSAQPAVNAALQQAGLLQH